MATEPVKEITNEDLEDPEFKGFRMKPLGTCVGPYINNEKTEVLVFGLFDEEGIQLTLHDKPVVFMSYPIAIPRPKVLL